MHFCEGMGGDKHNSWSPNLLFAHEVILLRCEFRGFETQEDSVFDPLVSLHVW